MCDAIKNELVAPTMSVRARETISAETRIGMKHHTTDAPMGYAMRAVRDLSSSYRYVQQKRLDPGDLEQTMPQSSRRFDGVSWRALRFLLIAVFVESEQHIERRQSVFRSNSRSGGTVETIKKVAEGPSKAEAV